MRKGFLYLGFAVLAAILVVMACEKDQLPQQASAQLDGLTLIDGRLAFEHETAFQQTLQQLYAAQDKLDEWEKNVPNYRSMRTYFESMAEKMPEEVKEIVDNIDAYRYTFTLLQEDNGDRVLERNLYNDVLATLINDEGYLQIGDQVHRFTYTHYYSVDVAAVDLLQEASLKNPQVMATKIEREVIFEDTEQANLKGGLFVGECISTSGNKRTRGKIIQEATFDNDCNIFTKHEKKVVGVWWANKASISVSYSGNFMKRNSNCSPAPMIFASGSGSEPNKSSITRTVAGNLSTWNGCSGQVRPQHDGTFLSTHVGDGKTCTLRCPPGASCN